MKIGKIMIAINIIKAGRIKKQIAFLLLSTLSIFPPHNYQWLGIAP